MSNISNTYTIADSFARGRIRQTIEMPKHRMRLDKDKRHNHLSECFKLYREIVQHYPDLCSITMNNLVSAYIKYLDEWGDSNHIHLAATMAIENNAHFIESESDDNDIDTDHNDDDGNHNDDGGNSINPMATNVSSTIVPKLGMKQGLIDLYLDPIPQKPLTVSYFCGICQHAIKRIDLLSMIDCCCHNFCYECISNWSKVKPNCPLCRGEIRRVDKLYWIERPRVSGKKRRV